MNRDTLIALAVALLLHAGFFAGGQFFKKTALPPVVAVSDDPIPVIELVPLPPDEPTTAPAASASSESSAEVVHKASAQLIDRPAVVMDTSFVQPIQPPPPSGLALRGGGISIPTGAGGGGLELGQGLANLFNLADLDQAPAPTLRVPPNYPFDMRRAGVSGEVLVGFIVDTAGQVRDAYAVSATRREFADEAVRAVLQWKFKPGRRSGVPVNTRMQVPLVFSLQSN